MTILKTEYANSVKKNLSVFEIPEKNLKGFTTTDKDKKRGIEKYPLNQFRNYDHDIFKDEAHNQTETGNAVNE